MEIFSLRVNQQRERQRPPPSHLTLAAKKKKSLCLLFHWRGWAITGGSYRASQLLDTTLQGQVF